MTEFNLKLKILSKIYIIMNAAYSVRLFLKTRRANKKKTNNVSLILSCTNVIVRINIIIF